MYGCHDILFRVHGRGEGMEVKILLPDLYRVATGKRKKALAWSYLQQVHPAHVPHPEQPLLETENVLLCTFDPEKARQHTRKLNERREEKKRKGKKR